MALSGDIDFTWQGDAWRGRAWSGEVRQGLPMVADSVSRRYPMSSIFHGAARRGAAWLGKARLMTDYENNGRLDADLMTFNPPHGRVEDEIQASENETYQLGYETRLIELGLFGEV